MANYSSRENMFVGHRGSFTSNSSIGSNNAIMMMFSIPIAMFVPVTIVGNLLVIVAVYRNHRLRTPTNLILTSLAVSDLLSGTFARPLNIYTLIDSHTFRPTDHLLSFPFNLLNTISFFHALTLTLDRYIAITRPLRYPALVTTNRTAYFLAVLWLVSGLMVALYTLMSQLPLICFDGQEASSALHWCMIWTSTLTVSALIICNVRILRIALKQYRSIAVQRGAVRHHPEEQEGVSRLKAVKTISIIVGLFCVAWAPFLIDMFAEVSSATYSDVYWEMITGMKFLTPSFNSALNPVVYGYRDKQFREAVLVILRSAWASLKCAPA